MQGMSVDGCSWGWKRILFMWEVELVEECIVLLSNISLHDNMEDTWVYVFY